MKKKEILNIIKNEEKKLKERRERLEEDQVEKGGLSFLLIDLATVRYLTQSYGPKHTATFFDWLYCSIKEGNLASLRRVIKERDIPPY